LKSKEKAAGPWFGILLAIMLGRFYSKSVLRLGWNYRKEDIPQMKLCLVVNKGENAMSFDIKGDAVSIGRSNENDIQIHDKYVSRHHLIVWKKGSRFFLKNLGNRNGTKVDGNRIASGATVEVKRGDTIAVGLSAFSIGEGSSGDMFAFLKSHDFCEGGLSNTSTVLLEDTIYNFV
jgi:hypothetical protein